MRERDMRMILLTRQLQNSISVPYPMAAVPPCVTRITPTTAMTPSSAKKVSPRDLVRNKRDRQSDKNIQEDDSKWPQKNKDGRQELEIRLGSEHISFETAKIGSLVDVTESSDPEGLRVFYYLVQDLKALIFSLISLHFKIKPI
ncbi:unnamed protein product [Penicillium pancosmium]